MKYKLRTFVLEVVMVAAAIALVAPLVGYAWRDKQARDREAPHPKLASQEDWHSILEELTTSGRFAGAPLPPPNSAAEAQARRESPPPPMVLVTSTLVLCEFEDPVITPGPACKGDEHLLQSGITSVDVDPRIPLKLRRELVVANSGSVAIPNAASWQWPLVERDAIRKLFKQGGWDGFYREFPQSTGIMEITHPVLSESGSQALIYVEASCGGLCGSGEIFLLERTQAGWKVLLNYRTWVS